MDAGEATEPARTAETGVDAAPSDERSRVGERLGRYELLELVGRGGMGVVYRARDPELDRDVAIKILCIQGQRATRARARLVREAQAMARISHPNVVPVFDVGQKGNEVYVAMEFIDGPTLREWTRKERRSVAELLEIFLQAGAGLAAAHDAGLVHRDFKPTNVMIDPLGRARVTDFGLVRAYDPATSTGSDRQVPITPSEGPLSEASLTTTATVVGTPAFMAPEQHMSSNVDQRADQFAFCVSLYEALYGSRPFAAKNIVEVARAKRRGEIVPLPLLPRTPPRVRGAIMRGLRARPEDRFPTMAALLAQLRPRSPLAQWLAAGTAVAAVVGIGIAVASPARDGPCEGAARKLDGVWDDARRGATRDAFLATHAGFAEATHERLVTRLDDYAARWAALHQDACEAVRRGEHTGEQLDLQVACLDARRDELATMVEGLDDMDTGKVAHVFDLVNDLPPLQPCNDVDSLARAKAAPVPASIADAVAAVQADLRRAKGLGLVGDARAGLELAITALATARELGFNPLTAEAAYRAGALATSAGEPRRSAPLLEEATLLAQGAGRDLLASEAAILLVRLYGSDLRDAQKAERWVNEAEALLERAGSPRDQRADLETARGLFALAENRIEEARQDLESALELNIEVYGPDHDHVGASLTNLGNVVFKSGDPATAVQHYMRALEIREASRGPEHPSVALLVHNIGLAYSEMEHPERATEYLQRALVLREAVYGTEHPRVAASLDALGQVAQAQGRLDEALPLLERAHRINTQVYGTEHPSFAESSNDLANVYLIKGDLEAARTHYLAALQGYEAQHGERHPDVAIALHNLGLVHASLGDHENARRYYARAVAVREDLLPPDHPKLAKSRRQLGLALVELGRHQEAIPVLRQALEVQRKGVDTESALAFAEFTLARALRSIAPAEARRLAKAARARIADDDGVAEFRTEIDTWIAAPR